MAMTFLQIVQEMADEMDFDQPTTLQNTVSTEVRRAKAHANKAYNYLWNKVNRRNEDAETTGTVTTVNGTDNYAIPSTLNQVMALQIGTDPPLKLLDWYEFDLKYKYSTYFITTTGYPNVAAIYNRRIYIYPTPDAAYTVNVKGKLVFTNLSADADEPAFRDDLHRIVLDWALVYQMSYENNPRLEAQAEIAKEGLQVLQAVQNNHGILPIVRMHEDDYVRYPYARQVT